LKRDILRRRIHVVNPTPRHDIDAEPGGMGDGSENVSRSFAPCRYNRVARFESPKEELEGTDFVSGTDRGIEILALDPAVAIAWYLLDGRGKIAQLCPRDPRKRREPAKERNLSVGNARPQPARLAE
jgi:hypothetical protein